MDYPYANGYQQQAYTPQQYQYNPGNPLQQQQWQQPRQQMQQIPQQTQPQPQGIVGRVLISENDLLPSDVTADGSMSWYPMQDGSSVVCRWKRIDGTIGSKRYMPESQEPPQPTQADRIEEKLNMLLGMLSTPNEEVANVEQ